MKTVDFLTLRPLGSEYILIPGEGAEVNFNKMISLNNSAAYLWQSLQGKDFDLALMSELLVDKYGIESERAASDASVLLDKWIAAGVVIK